MNNPLLAAIFIASALVSIPNMAEPFIPASSDTVIATWPIQDQVTFSNPDASSQESAVETSVGLLARASKPGQSHLYSLAQTTLMPWLENENTSALLWITWARIKQHKHDFEGTKQALNKALKLEPRNINAHLILARTHVIQQNYELAKQSCSQLIRSNDFISASVCLFEVASHQGELEQSYNSLEKLAFGLPENHPKSAWAGLVLADMAARQGRWQESEAWLDAYYSETDISTLIEWADVKLQLKKYQEVETKLSAVVQRTPSSEDALLVRLALAEKHLNRDSKQPWKQRITERVVLREQRQDLYHAGDLAIFYLDIEPNAEKALRWAEINWQQAREHKDEALLERARNAQSNSNIQDQS